MAWNYTCLSGLQKMIVIQQTFLRPAVTASMLPPFSGTKLILNYMAWWKKQKAIWYFHYFSWAISLRKIIFCFTVTNESPAVSCIPYWFFFSLLLWAEISIYLEFVSRQESLCRKISFFRPLNDLKISRWFLEIFGRYVLWRKTFCIGSRFVDIITRTKFIVKGSKDWNEN